MHASNAVKVKRKTGIIVFRVVVSIVLIASFWLGGMVLGAYFSILGNAPQLPSMYAFEGDLSTIIVDRDGNEIERLSGYQQREWAAIEQMPQHVYMAFIALEDERFFQHNGVDFRGFIRGIWAGIRYNSFQGGSTITQQYLKNALGVRRNTIETKLQEQFMAIEFERQLAEAFGGGEEGILAAKYHILEHYLNIIYFGSGQAGVRSAALFYFGKDLMDITIAEANVLAAIIQNPSNRNPRRFPERNNTRKEAGIERMLLRGFITEEEHAEAMAEPVYDNIVAITRRSQEVSSFRSYFVDQLFLEVQRDLMAPPHNMTAAEASNLIHRGGLRIYTTQDSAIQQIVDEVYIHSDELFIATGFEIEVTYIYSIQNTLTGRESHSQRKGTARNWDEVPAVVDRLREGILGVDDIIIAERYEPVVQPQSGFVIMDYRTGHVVAIAGGRGEKLTNRAFNRATLARRQPGSIFKVLASFAPALDLNIITPATVIDDAPYSWERFAGSYYEPSNWYARPGNVPFRGHHTIRTATAHSMNVIAVRNMVEAGLDESFEKLLQFGFSYGTDRRHVSLMPPDRNNPAVALGGITNGVTQLEVAAAFGAIANNGYYVQPTFYTKVYDRHGNVILEYTPEPTPVLRSTTAYLLTSMLMTSVHDSGSTGFSARLHNNGRIWMDVAGKTGTTQDGRDHAFVAYTPYYVASIYIGHDQPREITTGTSAHLTIWRTIMERVHQGLPNQGFPRPPGIVEVRVCRVSGMLPRADGLCFHDPSRSGTRNAVYTEVFAAGTAPTQTCTFHQPYNACNATGMRHGNNCAGFTVRAYRQMPADAYVGTEWIYDREPWAQLPGWCWQCQPAPPPPPPPPEPAHDEPPNNEPPSDGGHHVVWFDVGE
jgi:penicillin-binding protein 1A